MTAKMREIVSSKVTDEGGTLRVSDLVLSIGFDFMLAWHYLVLFSPVFGDLNAVDGRLDYLFERQSVLYVFLALTFGLTSVINAPKRQANKHSKHFWLRLVVIVGASSVVVSALYTVACYLDSLLIVRLIFVAALGVCEAFFMFLWLHCFVNNRSEHFLRSFATDMVIGGFLALIICCFQWPIGPIFAAVVPGISMLVLIRETLLGHMQPQSERETGSTEDNENSKTAKKKSNINLNDGENDPITKTSLSSRRNSLMTLFVAIYAFAFGLLQGSFIAANIPLLIVNDAVALLGIVVAGSVIFIIPDKLGPVLGIDIMHRASLITFILGAAVVSWFSIGDIWIIVSQIALLAGFNLFDFGVLVYGLEENRHRQKQGVPVSDRSRPVVYLCLTLGLLLGTCIIQGTQEGNTMSLLSIISGSSVIVLVATTLMPFYSLKDTENDDQREPIDAPELLNFSLAKLTTPVMNFPSAYNIIAHDVSGNRESTWKKACNELAKTAQLSPRETEIFFMVAKGRNVDYIQNNLTISPNTVKTHISKIYQKLDVHSAQEVLDLVEKTREIQRLMEKK